MAEGFYQRLGLRAGASDDEVRDAYHESLARLVRKLRAARANGADTAVLESERDELREAFEVITDPVRRRRYELMCKLDGVSLGKDSAAIQRALEPALLTPAVAAALDLVRDLTQLPVGGKAPAARPTPAVRRAPAERAVSMLDEQQREARAAAVLEPAPEPQFASPPPIVIPSPSMPELAVSVDAPQVAPRAAVTPALSGGLNTTERDFLAGNVGYDGRYLAALRQAKGVSLEQMADTTRISARYLKAIEDNAYDRLPAAVFVRGYLKEIVAVLEVPEDPFIRGYMALYSQQRGG